MGAVTYPDPNVVAELENWKRLSVDVDEQGDIAKAFGISSIPTAIALGPDGRILARMKGFYSPEKFAGLLTGARKGE